jgi:hypothetical protein
MTRYVTTVVEVKQVSLNPLSVSSVLNLEYEENEEKLVFDARMKRHRLEQQIDWQWEEADSSYCQNYWVFGLCPSTSILKIEHNISETGSQSLLAPSKGPNKVAVSPLT